MKQDILKASDIELAHDVLVRSRRRTLLTVAIGYSVFGFVIGLLAYFVPHSHDLGFAVLLGALAAVVSGPASAWQWSRHYARLFRELAAIKADVDSGMLVYNTAFEILTRHTAA